MKKQHLRALLDAALESLDTIGKEPVTPKDGIDYGKQDRAHARHVAKFIKEKLQANRSEKQDEPLSIEDPEKEQSNG